MAKTTESAADEMTPERLTMVIDRVMQRQSLLTVERSTMGKAIKWTCTHNGELAGRIIQSGMRYEEVTGLTHECYEVPFNLVCDILAQEIEHESSMHLPRHYRLKLSDGIRTDDTQPASPEESTGRHIYFNVSTGKGHVTMPLPEPGTVYLPVPTSALQEAATQQKPAEGEVAEPIPAEESVSIPPVTDPTDQRILEWVTEDPDLTDREIGLRLGISRQAANVRRGKLRAMGYTVR